MSKTVKRSSTSTKKRAPLRSVLRFTNFVPMQKQMRRMRRALRIAKEIIDYCPGDKWEAECTARDRKEFYKLIEEFKL